MDVSDSVEQLRANIVDLEAEVRSLEQKVAEYVYIFQKSPTPALVYHPETLTIFEANAAACALYEYESERLQGMQMRDLFVYPPGTDADERDASAPWEQELREQTYTAGPYWQRSASGRELLVRIVQFAFEREGGAVRIALLQDETAKQTTQEALRVSEERYRELFENANDVIFLQDFQGRIQSANRATESLTGYSRNELLGQDFAQMLSPEVRDLMLDNIRAHLGGSPAQRYELPIVTKTGMVRFLEVSTRIIYRGGHPVAVQGIGRDMTDWKLSRQALLETANELQIKNEELSTALRVAREATQLKEQFLANTSHELRTPMNGIMGMTNLLRDSPLTGEQREYVDAVSQCANDLLTIINDLLDMSQIEAGRFSLADEAFDFRDSVKSVVKLLQIRAGAKGLELSYEIDPALPVTMDGDCVRFRQILVNLIANAVKFATLGKVNVRLFASESGAKLRCEVVDSGPGVEESIQERIFEAFFQADGTMRRRYGGTGLGLAICKQLVQIMGGRIGMQNNTPFPGATFWFELPIRSASVARA